MLIFLGNCPSDFHSGCAMRAHWQCVRHQLTHTFPSVFSISDILMGVQCCLVLWPTLYFLIPNDIVLIWPSYIFFDEVCVQFFLAFIKLGCSLITDFELVFKYSGCKSVVRSRDLQLWSSVWLISSSS